MRLVKGSGRFFFGASLPRMLLEAILLALAIFTISNGVVVADYRFIAINYLPGALLALSWAAPRLRKVAPPGQYHTRRRLRLTVLTAADGLIISACIVFVAFLLTLVKFPLSDLAYPVQSTIYDNSTGNPTARDIFNLINNLFFWPHDFSPVFSPALVLVVRLLVCTLELAFFYLLVRSIVGILVLPGRIIYRQTQLSLIWRLTFSHFWVVVATIFTAVVCYTLLIIALNSSNSNNQSELLSPELIPVRQAREIAQTIADQQKAGASINQADLESFLQLITRGASDAKTTPGGLALKSKLPQNPESILDFVVITDREGRIITSSNQQRFSSGQLFLSQNLDSGHIEEWKRLLTRAGDGETRARQLAASQVKDGMLIAGAYAVKSAGGAVDQVVLVSEKNEVAFLSSTTTLLGLVAVSIAVGGAVFFISIFSLLIALAFGYFQSRRLLKHLDSLALAADALAAGNLKMRARLEAQDEIGRLAARFNLMAQRLEESQDNLAREKAKAEKALQTKRELVANVSHELRTPVSTIRGHVDWLLMTAEQRRDHSAADAGSANSNENESELYQYLDIIGRETERLSAMIEDLLDLSRIESSLSVKLEAVRETELVSEIKQALGPIAQRERKIVLTTDLTPDLPPVLADPTRLSQVITNLTRNAINYTPTGGIVSIGAALDGPDQVAVWVADTGVGIPAQELDLIFERFYRSDASRSRNTGGAGLGLAIVKALVEAMGGTITVESLVGEGSKFTVKLPVAVPTSSSLKIPPPASPDEVKSHQEAKS